MKKCVDTKRKFKVKDECNGNYSKQGVPLAVYESVIH